MVKTTIDQSAYYLLCLRPSKSFCRAPGNWMHKINKEQISNQMEQGNNDFCSGLGKTAEING